MRTRRSRHSRARLVAGLVAAALALSLTGGCRSAGARGAPRGAAPAAAPADDCLSAARPLFYRAADGDAEALRSCAEALRGCEVDAAKVLAYRGGCVMLEAARAPLPWDKGRLARRGMMMLDDAVSRSPDDPEVRFVRGMTNYHLPRFLGREKIAADDLAMAAGGAEDSVATGRLDPAAASSALFHHGVLLERAGRRAAALAAWRRSAAIAPASRAGTAAARALRENRHAARGA